MANVITLPAEIWKHIAMSYTVDGMRLPCVYKVLSQTCSAFVMNTPQIQEHYVFVTHIENRIIWRLANGMLHSPDYGKSPAVIHSDHSNYWYINERQSSDSIDTPTILAARGRKEWYSCGRLHRADDMPAVMHNDGHQEWWVNGVRHRTGDNPAIINYNGDQQWYIDGLYHRGGDKPAIIDVSGWQEWYVHGIRHRDGDNPAIITDDGSCAWYVHGKQHRDGDLPAVLRSDGSADWYKNNKLHRDGNRPAVITDEYMAWHIEGAYQRSVTTQLVDNLLTLHYA
jgi:hypothetical protein